MDQNELETLLHDIEELRRAVRRNNPFLRQVLSSRLYYLLTLVIGLVVLAGSLAAQVLVGTWGSFGAMPEAWRAAFYSAAAIVFLVGGGMKWVLFNRRARLIRREANYLTVIKAFYAGSWFHINVPSYLCALAGIGFAIALGHPWYALPVSFVFIALLFNNLGSGIQRPEYLVSGWYALVTALASFLFVERAPFVWLAVVLGGFCLVFAVTGLLGRDGGGER
ncbi:MAG TPA: hypothetical protein VFL04_06450 [Rectinemataceae bacterium]|nr:hypothetical protein [Rectinemataceae bacterium]